MLKSSILEILRTFSKQELAKFEDFVRSPYFNKKENVVRLYLEIKRYAPAFESGNLVKETVWKKLFPDANYNYGIMKNLIHDFSKMIVTFIELENYSLQSQAGNVNIISQYKSRGLLDLLKKKLQNTRDKLNRVNADLESFHYSYILEIKELEFLSLMHNVKDLNNLDFNTFNRNLSKYFFSMFFEVNAAACEISFLYSKPLHKDNFERTIRSYEESEFKDFFTEAQYFAFKTVYDPFCEDNYYKLKKLYYEHFDKFSKRYKYIFASALITFCKNNSNSGRLFYIKERYQYDKLIADKELFFFDGNKYVDRYMFMSIVIAACTAKEFDWCGQFIKKYETKLELKNREQTVNFAYTHLNFKSKNFEKSLSYLSKCKNASGMDKINIRTYQCFLYYELGYHEELKHLTDASRHFVKNDKTISNDSNEQFIKFVNIVNRLSDCRNDLKPRSEKEYQLKEIKNYVAANKMGGKNWLKEKIVELENNISQNQSV